jgi:hypothetical protein
LKKNILLFLLFLLSESISFSHPVDGIEHIFGATNINGISGNGGLTAGISKDGDLTLLKYPSPSYYDQLNYKTSNAEDARELKFFGANDNMGAFTGLIIYTNPTGELSWLRDNSWSKNQHYNTDDSNILVTEYSRDDYKIKVIQYDFVLPSSDVYVRHHVVQLLNGSPVEKVELVFYENLAPCNTKEPFVPTADWSDDGLNDFGILYYSNSDAFIHYKPDIVDYTGIKSLLQSNADQGTLDLFVEEMKSSEQNGIFAVIGSMSKSKNHQAGTDSSTQCKDPSISSLSSLPLDAFQDIQDTILSGSSIALCQANGAFIYPVEFNQFNSGEVTVLISFGKNLTDALNNYDSAKTLSPSMLLYETESYWKDLTTRINLPETGDSEVIAFSKRTILSALVSTDKSSGAIVASVSTQPPYGEDWPRDGAFINLALDIAGMTDIVTKHNYFYSQVQRKEKGQDLFGMYPDAPPGTFAMNYYADGMPGGPIDFEIDETGLALWTLVNHAKFLTSDSERCEYFERVYPSIKLAAQALTECKDNTNNLQCYAYEDDNYSLTQGLQGAVTVYLGLKSAVEAGRALKEDENIVNAWEQRANELKEAIFTHLLNHNTNSFEGRETGSRAWLLWPARAYEEGDPLAEKEAEELYAIVLPHLLKQTDGSAYLGKLTLSLARYLRNRPEKFNSLEEVILPLLKDLPTRGTRHVGEVFATIDALPPGSPDGIKDTFDARVAVPHIWEASLNYLSAMALYNPDAFDILDSELGELPCALKSGCGCASTSFNYSGFSSIFIGLVFIFLTFLLKINFNKRRP